MKSTKRSKGEQRSSRKRTALEPLATPESFMQFLSAIDAHAMVVYLDQNGAITFANDRICSVSGYSRKELIGKEYPSLLSSQHTSGQLQGLRQAIRDRTSWSGQLHKVSKNGGSFWVTSTLVPVHDVNEFHFIAVQTDITTSKLAECRSILSESRLMQRISELEARSRELHDNAANAEAHSKAKSAFLAQMSHEIRTPMNAIVATAELLRDSPLTPEQRLDLDVIIRAGQDLLVVINDILDISKLESGRFELHPVSFELRDFASRMGRLVESKLSEKGVHYTCVFDEALPQRIICDETRLGQIVLNMLANAVKFTPAAGEVMLSFEKDRQMGSQFGLKVSVEDSGIGIRPEKLNQVFKPFDQVDSSISRTYGGTGLGMAISKEFVERMGGRLGVTSRPERGTSFFFTIPVEEDPSEIPSERTHRVPLTLPLVQSGLQVLVAEDNTVNARILVRLLQRAGIEPVLVADGASAVAAYASSERGFDLVFMDLEMPVLDGLRATSEIRSLEKEFGHETFIVALTAHAMVGDRERCLDGGMDDYLTKPLDRNALERVLSRWSGEQELTASGTKQALC